MRKKDLQSSQGEMQKKAIIQEVRSKTRRNWYFKGDLKSESKKAESSVLQAVFPVCDAGVAVAGVRTAQRNSYTPPFLLTSAWCFWNTSRRHGSLDSSFWRTSLAFLLLQLRLGGIVKLNNRRRINRRRILRNKNYLPLRGTPASLPPGWWWWPCPSSSSPSSHPHLELP